jgi:hypothetical protein
VSSGTNCHPQLPTSRVFNGTLYILPVRTSYDHRWMLVDRTVVHASLLTVAAIRRKYQLAG